FGDDGCRVARPAQLFRVLRLADLLRGNGASEYCCAVRVGNRKGCLPIPKERETTRPRYLAERAGKGRNPSRRCRLVDQHGASDKGSKEWQREISERSPLT